MRVMGEFAFDGTVRSMDKDGRMHIAKSHISKATVNPYYGSEIPGYQALGLDAFRVYYLFRDPIELARGASTFARLPILSRHIPISAEDHPAELVVGAIGSDVEFNDPYLDADVCIWESEAISGIETETVREFSCAYRYTPVMTPGEYKGQRYDGIMTEIHGNHLALVETGRAGSDVLAADEDTMKKTKLGNALLVTLGAMSPKLAQDSALPALVGYASKKTFNVAETVTKLIALDSELDPTKLKTGIEVIVALDGGPDAAPRTGEADDPAEDDDPHPKDCDCKECKMAKDAEEEKSKKAMDAAISTVKRELREADEARRAVRDVVGDVVAQDSAEAIYGFALDHMKVDHKDVTGVPALKALFTVANSARVTAPLAPVAMDAAGAFSQFPNVNRFSQAY